MTATEKTMCSHPGCIAYAVPGHTLCAVHLRYQTYEPERDKSRVNWDKERRQK